MVEDGIVVVMVMAGECGHNVLMLPHCGEKSAVQLGTSDVLPPYSDECRFRILDSIAVFLERDMEEGECGKDTSEALPYALRRP